MLDIQATVVRAKVNVADADTLVQQGRMGTPNVVLLVVFAVELMLKVFLAHEGKKIKKTHKLGELFGELNDDTRSLSGIGSLEARINNLRAIPGL